MEWSNAAGTNFDGRGQPVVEVIEDVLFCGVTYMFQPDFRFSETGYVKEILTAGIKMFSQEC